MSENVEAVPSTHENEEQGEPVAETAENQDAEPKDDENEDIPQEDTEGLQGLPELPDILELPGEEDEEVGSGEGSIEQKEVPEGQDQDQEKDKKPDDELHELLGEGEEVAGEHVEKEEKKTEKKEDEEYVIEEQKSDEVDPAAPYNFSEEEEAKKAPFELSPDQIAECEALWNSFQDYTYAYTDIKGYVTIVELVFMLKAFQLQTFTPDQTQELIDFCVIPPNKDNFVYLEDFKRMVRIRTRDIHVEEAIRAALLTMDFDKTGTIDREYFRELLLEKGFKMPKRMCENFIKEIDVSGDGILGIEDIVGTMYIDLNYEDMQALRIKVWGPTGKPPPEETAPKEEEEEDDDEDKPPPAPEPPPEEPDF